MERRKRGPYDSLVRAAAGSISSPPQRPPNHLQAIQRAVEAVGSICMATHASGALVIPAERHCGGGVFTPAVRGAESAYKLTVIISFARRKSVVYSSGRDRAYEYLPSSERYMKNLGQL